MSERVRNIGYVLVMMTMAAIVTVLVATSPTDTDRVERLGNSIKCPVCQGESIADSPSSMARDMMAVVAQRVEEGRTDSEIVDELLASYSGAVLLDPPASGSTLFLWIAPIAALIMGAGVIIWWRTHPSSEAIDTSEQPVRSRRRVLVGGLILAGAFASIVVTAGFFLQEREGPVSGVANLGEGNLDDVSNETMEAVIAANSDNPQINGMRLALAERYFTAGDYRSAFPHYLAVAQSETSTEPESVAALIRLGWMAWDGNGEVDTAIGLFDQALAIDPDSSTARYLKGQVLWCGAGQPDAAAELFAQVVDSGMLPADSLDVVEADLQAVTAGEACT